MFDFASRAEEDDRGDGILEVMAIGVPLLNRFVERKKNILGRLSWDQ